MDPGSWLIMLVLVVVFVLLNAFFVLSEFCIVKARRTKLEEQVKAGKMGAKMALKVSIKLDTYLSACQLGITLSSLALGWIGEPAIAKLLNPLFESFKISPTLAHTISFAIAFSIITLLHVVLGELVPKSIAIQKANACALIIARPLHLFWILFLPFIRVFDFLAAIVLKALGFSPTSENESSHSEKEIKIIASQSEKGGVLNKFETELIHNALDFSDTMAKEIMTPRKKMICLDSTKNYEENMKIIAKSNHTRYPYIKASKDRVIGIIHLRDLMQNELSEEKRPLEDFSRKAIIVPEHIAISKVLLRMTKERSLTALVIDEYGGTAGLLTMEDIIEEIVGEINDEHDIKEESFKKLAENIYEFEGSFEIEEAFELLSIDYDEDKLLEVSVGGYVFNLFGRIPVKGEKIEDGYCYYVVKEVKDNSIKKIKMVKKQKAYQDFDL